MVINVRKVVNPEITDKAFEVMFLVCNRFKFSKLFGIKFKNINVEGMPYIFIICD